MPTRSNHPFLLLAFLVSACVPLGPTKDGAQGPSDGTTPQASEGVSVELRPVLQLYYSGMRDSLRTVVRSPIAWQILWSRIYTSYGEPPAPATVDFANEMVVVAALGMRSSGGYAIHLDGARVANGVIEVFVRAVAPGRSCGTTAAITEPVVAAVMQRTEFSVRFVERRVIHDC